MPDITSPVLILSWGNPSRGDDAIGPRMHAMLEAAALPGVELQTDFQLQIEHAVDLERRERILFVDASMDAGAPFTFQRIFAADDTGYTTHAMSPQAVLAVYARVNGTGPAPAFMLSVRGYAFDLGQPLTARADDNLQSAFRFVRELLALEHARDWANRCTR